MKTTFLKECGDIFRAAVKLKFAHRGNRQELARALSNALSGNAEQEYKPLLGALQIIDMLNDAQAQYVDLLYQKLQQAQKEFDMIDNSPGMQECVAAAAYGYVNNDAYRAFTLAKNSLANAQKLYTYESEAAARFYSENANSSKMGVFVSVAAMIRFLSETGLHIGSAQSFNANTLSCDMVLKDIAEVSNAVKLATHENKFDKRDSLLSRARYATVTYSDGRISGNLLLRDETPHLLEQSTAFAKLLNASIYTSYSPVNTRLSSIINEWAVIARAKQFNSRSCTPIASRCRKDTLSIQSAVQDFSDCLCKSTSISIHCLPVKDGFLVCFADYAYANGDIQRVHSFSDDTYNSDAK